MPVRETNGERDCQPTGLMGGFGVGCIKIPNEIKIPAQIKIPDSAQNTESSESVEVLVRSFKKLVDGFFYGDKNKYQPSAPATGIPSSGRAE